MSIKEYIECEIVKSFRGPLNVFIQSRWDVIRDICRGDKMHRHTIKNDIRRDIGMSMERVINESVREMRRSLVEVLLRRVYILRCNRKQREGVLRELLK